MAAKSSRRQKILIVDDEPLFVSSVAEGLSTSNGGYDVLTAGNGMEAIHLVEQNAVDLVITDLKMPEVDGFELLRYLMRHHPRISVLVLTAFGTPAIEEHVRTHGAVDYLEKPIDLQVLAERIEQSLSRSSRGHLQGITLYGFLQLLALERKTCTLAVRASGQEGMLYFQSGELIHAEAAELSGEPAAYAIARWASPEIDIQGSCHVRQRTISTPLTQILLDAARLEDEGDAAADPEELGGFFAGSEGSTEVHPPELPTSPPAWPAERVPELLERALQIGGALGAAVFDATSARCWVQAKGTQPFDLRAAAAGVAGRIKAEAALYRRLGLSSEIEEVLHTARGQYHLTRISRSWPELYFYLVLERGKSNVGMARLELEELDRQIEAPERRPN